MKQTAKWRSSSLKGVAFIAVLGLSSIVQALPHATSRAVDEPELRVLLSSDKTDYRLSEKIQWDVRLLNAGAKHITVFGKLRWGYFAGLTIHVADARNREIFPRFNDEDIIHPGEEKDRNSFVVLAPEHYLGTTRPDIASELVGEAGPGTYFVYVQYKIPLAKKEGKGPNFWSIEEPRLYSNRVEIHLTN